MAKTEKNNICKLSDVNFGELIEIGGFEFEFTGFEKRRTKFGIQQHFIFKCHETGVEKIFERFKYSSIKIKKNGEKYKW